MLFAVENMVNKEVGIMPRRGENIYKRKDGRWEGRYIESYSRDGKAKYHSVYGHTYNEVKLKLKNNALTPKSKSINITVSEWISNYIESQKDKIKISTYNVYIRYMNNHISPFFKKIELRKLNRDILQGFVDAQKGLSPSTIKGIFSTVREALKAAHAEGYIGVIWVDVEIPKKKKQNISVFSKEEQKMIECSLNIDEFPNELGILICLYTGLRIGEVCGLKWQDINFQSNSLYVNRTIQRISIDSQSQLVELPPKSESSCRKIPIPTFLMEYLNKVRLNSSDEYVLSINSHMMDPRTYQNQYKRILKKSGVKYINFHGLRHTFSVRALEAGFDIKTLSEILGHADATITLQRYAHSLDEHKRNSMERLSELRVSV